MLKKEYICAGLIAVSIGSLSYASGLDDEKTERRSSSSVSSMDSDDSFGESVWRDLRVSQGYEIEGFFDPEHYLTQLEGEIPKNPLEHFQTIGWKKGYNPNPWFDMALYQKYYPSTVNPFEDWLTQTMGTQEKVDGEEELIFSLTSYGPRIGTAYLAIESLLRQTRKPNRVVLSLALADFPTRQIPKGLEYMKERGLDVRFSDVNYRVATKLLPTLKDFPEAVIVTADDDRIYAPDWAEVLMSHHRHHPTDIIACSAREYAVNSETPGNPFIDYLKQKPLYNERSGHGIFEGFTGVLYPPHALDSEVFNFDNFKRLTPYADDVWFQAMAIKKGTKVRGLTPEETAREDFRWPQEIDDTQAVGLFHDHLDANGWMAYRVLKDYNLFEKMGIQSSDHPECQSCGREVVVPGADYKYARGKGCKTCLNSAPLKILQVGAAGYGNIGDDMYPLILRDFFKDDYEFHSVSDTVRLNKDGHLMDFTTKEDDLSFDALIVGGGGILRDFQKSSSVRYYMEQAAQRRKPYFILSAGMQTDNPNLTEEGARQIIGGSSDLLKTASLIFARSQTDEILLRKVLGEEIAHKIFYKPDLGYLSPMFANSAAEKKYVSLIQTGSVNVNNPATRTEIDEQLAKHPDSKLVVMNWGGLEEPLNPKDFSEWDLFQVDVKKLYPDAQVYMGGTLDPRLKDLRYPKVDVRDADLTVLDAIRMVNESHHVISGRYHGNIVAKALGVSYNPSAINTYKVQAERLSNITLASAADQIRMVKSFMLKGIKSIPAPGEWSPESRNTYIEMLKQRQPSYPLGVIQILDNGNIYRSLVSETFDNKWVAMSHPSQWSDDQRNSYIDKLANHTSFPVQAIQALNNDALHAALILGNVEGDYRLVEHPVTWDGNIRNAKIAELLKKKGGSLTDIQALSNAGIYWELVEKTAS